ncbi:ERI1 exoribonuclease 3 [Boothiomyces macroporosus]|uniref:ERI1 exoribonuclease 3 n=1 Tax=Boothiomyces macroporosus TaxID=261099 RepID=A0AAD5Y2K0_9FUNG|nr:ERI1 exoribonuclease 3 [Boothiomyces macroporosus]
MPAIKAKYILILDFEATCGEGIGNHNQEIIEFPIVVVEIATLKVVDEFHTYVKPTTQILPFCTELTGITQEQVENAPPLSQVLPQAEAFAKKYQHSVFVTCGDWDLKTMLPLQTERENLSRDSVFQQWVNVKVAFNDTMEGARSKQNRAKGMKGMLNALGLELVGRHHSGIDDSRNIAKIAIELIKKGYVFRVNI